MEEGNGIKAIDLVTSVLYKYLLIIIIIIGLVFLIRWLIKKYEWF